jgi:hypothetical protein
MDTEMGSITERRDLRTGTPVWASLGAPRLATRKRSRRPVRTWSLSAQALPGLWSARPRPRTVYPSFSLTDGRRFMAARPPARHCSSSRSIRRSFGWPTRLASRRPSAHGFAHFGRSTTLRRWSGACASAASSGAGERFISAERHRSGFVQVAKSNLTLEENPRGTGSQQVAGTP